MSWKWLTSSSPTATRAGARISPSRARHVRRERLLVRLVPDWHLQLERAALHLPDALAHGRVDRPRRPPSAVHPHSQVDLDGGVQVAALQGGFLGLQLNP